jgi:branched-chain amino acid transport system substrate-binding protein
MAECGQKEKWIKERRFTFRCRKQHRKVIDNNRHFGGESMNAFKLVGKSMRRSTLVGLLIWIAAFFLVNCIENEPIRVGFVAQLTGVQAELGVQERNGVQLAVEEINAAGGVAGRPIELIVQDDLGTPEGAQAADLALIEAGVVAIIGHATSGQTMAGLAVTNPAHIVMLSPTVTTPELSGQDDYFFRVAYSLDERARALAQRIYRDRNITQVAVIHDTDNAAYSKAYQDAFADKYQSLGGKLVAETNFSSKVQPDFTPLVAELHASNPGGLLIIAPDIDTALIAQRTRLIGWPIPLFATAWAQTETLINNGGQAVEGLEIEIANTLNEQAPNYLDFKTRYQARFGQAPSFGATAGYEAAKVLAAALQETGGKPDGLAQALLGIKNFKGLTDTFSFDRYGDVVRPFHLGVIRDGKYVDIEALEQTEP